MGLDCLICGRCATGVHYGVLACEGCKAFYRREVKKNDPHLCFFGSKCSTEYSARVRCSACRFKKCAALGMKVRGLELPGAFRCGKKKATEKCPALSERNPIDLGLDHIDVDADQLQIDVISSSSSHSDMHFADGRTSSFGNLDSPTDSYHGGQALCSYSSNSGSSYLSESTGSDENNTLATGCSAFMSRCRFPSFTGHYWDNLTNHSQQTTLTIYAVAGAVEVVFGDQISRFNYHMNRALCYDEIPHQPQAPLEVMVNLMNEHNRDSRVRTQRFADMLPGTAELAVSPKCLVTLGWKSQVLCMMHHSPFMTPTESYILVGPPADQLHYGRYWQEMTTEASLLTFVYRFCEEFRKIGLNQTELYIVMAIVMFEPSEEIGEQSSKLKLLHRHYTDVLVDALKRRCADASELFVICSRLERFFDFLKMACQLHAQHFPGQGGGRALEMACNCVWQH